MIDYDTILSTTEDKMTLLQWLKKVEAALKDASATTFKVNKKGDATLTFSIVFADGSELESGEIILQQGESVQSAAIVNGHLILTLTNGDELDAGDLGGVTSFSIDASQHLIVTYQNGTTQDLGAIFAGDVNIAGVFTASHAKVFEQIEDANGNNRFVEGDITIGTFTGVTQTYGKWSLCGTHLLIVIGLSIEAGSNITGGDLCYITIPSWIGAKIYPLFAGNVVTRDIAKMWADDYTTQDLTAQFIKISNATFKVQTSTTTADKNRFVRINFDLLIDNN
jgi:hypothetical protein